MDSEFKLFTNPFQELQKGRIYKGLGAYMCPYKHRGVLETDGYMFLNEGLFIVHPRDDVKRVLEKPQTDEPIITEDDEFLQSGIVLGSEYNGLGTFMGFGVLGDIVNSGLENVFCYYFTKGSYSARQLLKMSNPRE